MFERLKLELDHIFFNFMGITRLYNLKNMIIFGIK